MSVELKVGFAIAASVGIILLLWFFGAMFRREAVKRELHERDCQPLHIWWCPFAYWAPCHPYSNITPFRVIYRDTEEQLHKAYCYVYQDLFGSPFGPRRVEWIKDELRDFNEL